MGRRRTRITIETDEIVVARRVASPVARPLVAWCPTCEIETGMVTPTQAALLLHVNREAIEEWVRSGQLHGLEHPEKGLLICIRSLGRHQWQREP